MERFLESVQIALGYSNIKITCNQKISAVFQAAP